VSGIGVSYHALARVAGAGAGAPSPHLRDDEQVKPASPQHVVIPCADGYALHGSSFPPEAPPRGATVIVCSAMLVRHGFYAAFAAHLARRGFRVLTYDNRGVGTSLAAQPRGMQPRLRGWGEQDLPAAIVWAERSEPSHRLFIVGHSMGGQLVALSDALRRVEAVVTVAATAAWFGHWPLPHAAVILAWYLVAPLLGRLLPTLPAGRVRMGPDVAATIVRDWTRWGRHEAYLHGPFGLESTADRYRGRVLAFSFTDDVALGCRRAVDVLHHDYVAADLERRHVSPAEIGARRLGHFGFFRGSAAAALWDQTIDWLDRGPESSRRASTAPRTATAAPSRG